MLLGMVDDHSRVLNTKEPVVEILGSWQHEQASVYQPPSWTPRMLACGDHHTHSPS